MEFIVKRDGCHGFVVSRKNKPREYHAHISTANGARTLINFINQGLLPRSVYLQGSARRLLTDEEYQRLKRPKQKYYNKSGHNKRT